LTWFFKYDATRIKSFYFYLLQYLGDYEYDVAVRNVTVDIKLKYEFIGGFTVEVFFYLQTLLNFTYEIRADVDTFDFNFNFVNKSLPPIDLYVASYSLIKPLRE